VLACASTAVGIAYDDEDQHQGISRSPFKLCKKAFSFSSFSSSSFPQLLQRVKKAIEFDENEKERTAKPIPQAKSSRRENRRK
jgi:hypothetical protein